MKINLRNVNFSLDNINTIRIVYAFWGSVAFLLIKAVKWYYLLKSQNEYVDFLVALKSIMSGLSLGLITPAHTGEISRALFIGTENRIKVAGLVVVDRLFDLLGVLMLSIMGAFFFNRFLGIFAIALCISLLFLFIFFRNISERLGKFMNRVTFLKKLSHGINDINKLKTNSIIYMSVLSILPFAIGILQFYFLVFAFEKISFKSVFLTAPIIALVNLMPITIAGIGVREGSAILLLSNFNVSPEASAGAAFIQFFMNSAIPAIMGVIFIPSVRMFKKKINSDLTVH